MAIQEIKGAFVPTTNIWDVSNIYSININSDDFKELLVRLYQNLNLMSVLLNGKDSGFYPLAEFITGQTYFPNPAVITNIIQAINRPVYRATINFGALPNTGTKSVAHGIPFASNYTVTRIYGAASDTTGLNYIPLPYASPVLANNIELKVDGTNVTVITGSNRSNFNISYIVLEYLKQ